MLHLKLAQFVMQSLFDPTEQMSAL